MSGTDLVFYLSIFLFFLLWLLTVIPTEEERKFKIIYSEYCGIWYRFLYFSPPFARIKVFEEFLIIVAVMRKKMNWSDIISLSKIHWIFPEAIKIVFKNQAGKKEKVIVWCCNSDFLLKKISEVKDGKV